MCSTSMLPVSGAAQLVASGAIITDRPSPLMLRLIGLFNRELKEALEVVGQFDRRYVTDASAFEAAFGPVEVTDHRDALAATVAWGRARHHNDAVPA